MKTKSYIIYLLFISIFTTQAQAIESVFPGENWETKTPQFVQLDEEKLDEIAEYLGGRGFIARHGYQVYTWGDYQKRADIASAAKPFYSHFLFHALEHGMVPSLDVPVYHWEPKLAEINAKLHHKDKAITWRHVANQTSCYGLTELPGTAFDYNDWQMALFWDTLFLKVFDSSYEAVDADVFHRLLMDKIGCQDNPTMLAFGKDNRAGRVGISPRDHARFGLLYLHKGRWKTEQLLSKDLATMAVSQPVSNLIPRAGYDEAEMIPDQSSIGSTRIPDNQTEHHGSYSWLWWINGQDKNGEYYWPDAPADVFNALGHKNGKRGMAVIPSMDIVIAWNDTKLDQMESDPHPLNKVFQLLALASNPKQAKKDSEKTDMQTVRITMAQTIVLPGDHSGNFKRIEHALQDAVKQNADIVCFPEASLFGWVNPDAHKRAQPIPGKDTERLGKLAKQYGLSICIGLEEKQEETLYNSLVFINEDGELMAKHRKTNILSELMEPPYTPGNSITTFNSKYGKIGLLICADTFVGENLDAMAKEKPDLMLVPYGWAEKEETWPDHGKELEKVVINAARVIGAPVIATDSVGIISTGKWAGRVFGGQSLAVNAHGVILAKCKDRDKDVVTLEVQLPVVDNKE